MVDRVKKWFGPQPGDYEEEFPPPYPSDKELDARYKSSCPSSDDIFGTYIHDSPK
jgi:hypothetical protein